MANSHISAINLISFLLTILLQNPVDLVSLEPRLFILDICSVQYPSVFLNTLNTTIQASSRVNHKFGCCNFERSSTDQEKGETFVFLNGDHKSLHFEGTICFYCWKKVPLNGHL